MPRRQAGNIDVVVIGAGHSGLAMSRVLSERAIDHVVLERAEVANSWRSERWDSLRLFTPNWMTRLPGYRYQGDDPDGYMGHREVADFISAYARWASAPVLTQTSVTRVRPDASGYRVSTDRGDWVCRAVVLATGACNTPIVPRIADSVPSAVQQLSAQVYRNPDQLAFGRVLIVGGSATGVQLAHEIAKSGRPVTLAVGEHVRMPRTYRGRDIQWWMLASGLLDQRIEQLEEPERARRVPSPQLVGTPEPVTFDLNALRLQGIEIVGRLAGVRDGKAQFSGSLRNVCALADLKLNRLLASIDAWAERTGWAGMTGPAERYAPTDVGNSPRLGLDLGRDVRTLIWATGFRPDHSWLQLPVFDGKGALRHAGGVADAPGLYVLGLPYLRRRKSSFIHGAEDDVRELGSHLAEFLDRQHRPRSLAPIPAWSVATTRGDFAPSEDADTPPAVPVS
jgi:putative flavoprotein involved in K+ transport